MVLFHDLLDRGKAQTDASPLRGEKRLKHLVDNFCRNRRTVVLDEDLIFYPAPRASEEFRAELSAYKGGKGTVQFPLSMPIPHDLIRRIVEFRVRERTEGRRG